MDTHLQIILDLWHRETLALTTPTHSVTTMSTTTTRRWCLSRIKEAGRNVLLRIPLQERVGLPHRLHYVLACGLPLYFCIRVWR